jgi:putative sterol carrier protein
MERGVVAYFSDAGEVYELIGGLLDELAADDELAPKFLRANTVVQFQLRDPDVQLTVRMREAEGPQVDRGPTELQPEVLMTMDTDIAHRFWLGKVNPTIALARGQMKAKGPVTTILRLVPLTRPGVARYRARLERAGRSDLLDV